MAIAAEKGEREQYMRDDKKELRVKRYQLVASRLFRCVNYTTVEEMADSIKMDKNKFRTSIQRAKELLSVKGIAVVNKISKRKKDGEVSEPTGYRIATSGDEYFKEVDKTVRRSAAHIGQQIKILLALKESGKLDWDFDKWIGILQHNISSMIIPSKRINFKDGGFEIEEFMDSVEYNDKIDPIVVHHAVYDIPEEMVDPDDPEGESNH